MNAPTSITTNLRGWFQYHPESKFAMIPRDVALAAADLIEAQEKRIAQLEAALHEAQSYFDSFEQAYIYNLIDKALYPDG